MIRHRPAQIHQPPLDGETNRSMRALRAAARFVKVVLTIFYLSGVLATSAVAAEQAPVTIPNFWDLAQKREKPDLAGLRVIRFMTEDEYPPLNFTTEEGRLAGFNVDLARAICDVLNVGCTIQARRWDTLFESLGEGRGDAVIASVRPTPALRQKYAFSAPYLRTPARFVVRTGTELDPSAPDGLKGRKVAVVAATAHENFLQTFFPAAQIMPYPDLEAARTALASGAVDALFGDGLTLAVWLNAAEGAGCCAFAGGPYTESRWFGEGVAIAFRPGEPALRRAVDYALQRLAEKGTYAELYLRYFPVGFY